MVLAGVAIVAVSAKADPPNTGMADPSALVSAFDHFAAGGAPANVVILSLSNLRGVSSEAVNAGGRVTVDLATGTVGSSVELLPPDGTFDLWLIDNQPDSGHTTLAEDGDALMKVGTYAVVSGEHRLSVTLDSTAFTSFFPDRAFVVRSGESPIDGFVLTGSSTFFARLSHRQIRFVDDAAAALGFDPTATATREADAARVIAQGRQLFLHETFAGNGRTCGTCHVETNNFTVDPDLIATLPPSDPLFVAETNPALAALENPDLLRQVRIDPRQRRRIRPVTRVRLPRRSERASARELVDAPGSELWHRLQHQRAESQSTRAPRLGQRWPTAPRLRARRHRAACPDDAEPDAACRLPGTDG